MKFDPKTVDGVPRPPYDLEFRVIRSLDTVFNPIASSYEEQNLDRIIGDSSAAFVFENRDLGRSHLHNLQLATTGQSHKLPWNTQYWALLGAGMGGFGEMPKRKYTLRGPKAWPSAFFWTGGVDSLAGLLLLRMRGIKPAVFWVDPAELKPWYRYEPVLAILGATMGYSNVWIGIGPEPNMLDEPLPINRETYPYTQQWRDEWHEYSGSRVQLPNPSLNRLELVRLLYSKGMLNDVATCEEDSWERTKRTHCGKCFKCVCNWMIGEALGLTEVPWPVPHNDGFELLNRELLEWETTGADPFHNMAFFYYLRDVWGFKDSRINL